jgi:hypothetical protein
MVGGQEEELLLLLLLLLLQQLQVHPTHTVGKNIRTTLVEDRCRVVKALKKDPDRGLPRV